MVKSINIHLLLVAVLVWSVAGLANASDTMLMFVGEDLEVLSIASRREEAAWSAPAIASVITREDIEQKGAVTISQALEDTTGFHMNQTEKGSIPYLRGIPNSALFLFDTVPMGPGAKKSDNMIDYETSLAPIKRIEVVRGAGSVLWGPDAFAGVVNAVPLSGRDFQGFETGIMASSGDVPGEAYFNWGTQSSDWASFVSVSGRMAKENGDSFNVVKFWNDGIRPEPLETRYGNGSPDDSGYVNLYGSLAFQDWLTLSVKAADNKNAYTVTDWNKTYSWEEQTNNSTQVVKLEAVKAFNADSGLRFTGYYSQKNHEQVYVDRGTDQDESSWFGEIIWDQSLLNSKGLATLGTSYRRDRFDNVPFWGNYLPRFLESDNTDFLPEVNEVSFKNNLASAFGQYRHEFDQVNVWAGIRYDDHNQYEDKTSYNGGFSWDLGNFLFKSIYGTAYRNPAAREVYPRGEGTRLEKIENLNAQLSWKDASTKAAITLFNNRIGNHLSDEERYLGAGFSIPNKQTINGIEVELSRQVTERFKLSGNLTLLDNSGPNETYFYRYFDSHYRRLEYAYDTGPKTMGNIRGIWQITDQVALVPELKYFSQRTLYYPVDNITQTCNDAWVMDLNLLVRDVFPFDLSVYLNNIFDTNYSSPGLYSITNNQSFHVGFKMQMAW